MSTDDTQTHDAANERTELNIGQRLNKVMAEIGRIEKTKKNSDLKFAYAGYDDIAPRLQRLFVKWGVLMIPAMSSARYETATIVGKYGDRQVRTVLCDMAFTIINADDPNDRLGPFPWVGESMAIDDKTVSKAGTSGTKFFISKFLLLNDQNDPDGDSFEDDERVIDNHGGRKVNRATGEILDTPQSTRPAPPAQAPTVDNQVRLSDKAQKLHADIKASHTMETLTVVRDNIKDGVEAEIITQAERVVLLEAYNERNAAIKANANGVAR